jgi:hypothetical protein
MLIERISPDQWSVTVEPNELELTATKSWPHRTLIGFINKRGTLRISRPSVGAPRIWGQVAKYKLEDARDQLRSQGVLFDKKFKENIAKRKEERRTGRQIIRTTNPKYPENRFHGGRDPSRWAERVLTLSPNGTIAGFFHDSGVYASKPYELIYKDDYGHIKQGSLDMWPRSSGSLSTTLDRMVKRLQGNARSRNL